MSYNFKNPATTSLRQYRGVGDDDEDAGAAATFLRVFQAFMPQINALQAAGDANVEAQVNKIIQDATGGAPTAPVTTTSSGSTSPSSTSQGDFNIIGFVAKPKSFPALGAAKELQLQLNRAAKARGLSTQLSVDGAIGPATVSLAAQLAGVSGLADLLDRMVNITSTMQLIGDSAGIATPNPAKTATAGAITVVSTTGKTQTFKPPGVHPSIFDKVSSLPDTVKIAGGAGLLLGGALMFRRLRKKNPARRRARGRGR